MPIAAPNLESRFPLLVTGIAGVAGFNAFHHFHRRYPGRVIGIRPHRTWGLRGDGIVPLDAEDAVGMRELFCRYRFRSVLNTTGNCALKSCELDPAMARLLNVESVAVMLENVLANGCRLVHVSSDLVFSGTLGRAYRETDITDPVTVYGKTMVDGERLVQEFCPSAAMLRISLPMGPSFNRHAGAIDWIWSRFRANRPATLYFDEVRSCTYVEDLNGVFARFLRGDEAGLFHAGGPRSIALYQIGQVVNRVGGAAPHLLKGCPRIEAGPMPPRAGDVTMDSRKLVEACGVQPFRAWPAEEGLWPAERNWHCHRTASELGSHKEIARRLHRYSGELGA